MEIPRYSSDWVELVLSFEQASLVHKLCEKHNSELSLWIAKDIEQEVSQQLKLKEDIEFRKKKEEV